MRTIFLDNISNEMANLVLENSTIDEDIGILDKGGNLLGIVITPKAYEFFLQKIEEEEGCIDHKTVSDFHRSGEKNQ